VRSCAPIMVTLAAANELVERKHFSLYERQRLTRKVEKAVARMDDDGEIQPRGCEVCSVLFGRRKGAGNASKQVARLATTGDAVRARAEALQTKVNGMREQARVLNAAGKKQEAILMLRRSKPVEKQLATALASADALDLQVLVLEDANLQQQVSSALSASVKKVKKGTKGLLKSTENAVDGAEQVRDLTEDVSQALEGLRPVDADEDDLLEELQAMMDGGDGPPPSDDTIKQGVAVTEPVASSIPIASYPAAPTQSMKARKKEEKSGLLAAAGEDVV
jgi:hypothetical protein